MKTRTFNSNTSARVSKSAAGLVIGFLLVGMFATSTYALRGEPHLVAADTLEIPSPPARLAANAPDFRREGRASYYGYRFQGRPTASGEIFDPGALTAAHRTLPFGTRLRVTNVKNGRSVVVRINDRGPFAHGRIIDVSRAAAEKIGMIRSGTAPVRLERVE